MERKAGSVTGSARIGRVKFSKTGRTFYYGILAFMQVKGGYKYNCIEVASGEAYWISGCKSCKKNGSDSLYGARPVPIDEDCREEYWTVIRQLPSLGNEALTL